MKDKKKKPLTAHEKKLELAKASKPSYGIYIDGGSVDKLAEAIALVGPAISSVLSSDSEEKTKCMALDIIKNSVPSVAHCNINNVSINMDEDA
jgi:hypothetical protein